MGNGSRRLQAPVGTDEANHADKAYRVDNDSKVVVPNEAVDHLLKTGGFVDDEAEDVRLCDGHVMMHGASCSWRGMFYEADHDGLVMVPIEAIGDLSSHGFVVV